MAVIEAIETVYLEVDTATFSFSSIAGYKHLQIRFSANTTQTGSDNGHLYLQFNDVTSADYDFFMMYTGYSASVDGFASGGNNTRTGTTGTMNLTGNFGGGPIEFGAGTVLIPDYLHATKNCSSQALGGKPYVNGQRGFAALTMAEADIPGAMTKITVLPSSDNWQRGSSFTLYGIKSS
jgi:hypothetical protein